MLLSSAFVLLACFWALLFLCDTFIKSHPRLVWISTALDHSGISIHLAQLRWYTTRLNRIFVSIGNSRSRFLRKWFNIGVVFGCVAMAASMLLLCVTLVNLLLRKPVEQQVLVPVMPGVNLPMSQISYYLLTLFFCAVFHEVGHAVAAVCERVHVNGFGVFLLILYPGAFVDLSTDLLATAAPWSQLRIFCAGVWHNCVIAVVALVTIVTLPIILMPFYVAGNGIIVTGLPENSALSGPRGLELGDVITSMNSCPISSVDDWSRCISELMKSDQHGYCLSTRTLRQQDISLPQAAYSSMSDCCMNTSSTHLCFQYQLQPSPASLERACLPARSTVSRSLCRTANDCQSSEAGADAELIVCVQPQLPDNLTRLVTVQRHHALPVIFLGHSLDLFYSAFMSNYEPRSSLIPLDLPYIVDTLCRYLVSLSGALAVLNVVPCYALDGQWILLGFTELAVKPWITDQRLRAALYWAVLAFGTSLLAANIVAGLWVLFVS